MSTAVTYGTYNFSPAPFLDLDNEIIFLSGQLDYMRQSVSLVGNLTGCNLTDLKLAKDDLVAACSTGFQELTVGNTGFSYAKPISISFQDSKLTKILPFEISFEAYQNQDFSQFYGIIDPVDTWSFSEEAGRIVSATHEVSARAVKTTADSMLAARNFVNGRLNGFENLSLFHSGDTNILVNKSESLNRMDNTYGVTEQWSLSTAVDSYDTNGCIIRPVAQVDWNNENFTINVNGTIEGGISGSASTGYFTPEQAKEFAQKMTQNFKSTGEQSYYEGVFRGPSQYQYNIITGANSIDFNFSFADPSNTNTGEVNHEFSVGFNASKDTPHVVANIQGRVFYDSYKDIFLTNAPEEETRYKKVEAYFSGVNPYAITQLHFGYFNEGATGTYPHLSYVNRPLETRYEQIRISKLPFDSVIEYDFTYSNKLDLFSGQLLNSTASVSCDHSIPKWKVTPTIDDSFCAQELYQSLERKTLSVNGTVPTGVSIGQAILTVSGWMNQYVTEDGTLVANSCQTGNNQLSMTKTYVLK